MLAEIHLLNATGMKVSDQKGRRMVAPAGHFAMEHHTVVRAGHNDSPGHPAVSGRAGRIGRRASDIARTARRNLAGTRRSVRILR
jgi:hypothetical protein